MNLEKIPYYLRMELKKDILVNRREFEEQLDKHPLHVEKDGYQITIYNVSDVEDILKEKACCSTCKHRNIWKTNLPFLAKLVSPLAIYGGKGPFCYVDAKYEINPYTGESNLEGMTFDSKIKRNADGECEDYLWWKR